MAARLTPAFSVPEAIRRPLLHMSMLTVAMVAGVAMAFLTQTLLARELGPASYGLFASSLVTVTMLAPLAGFGLTQFRLKVYGVEGWGAHRWMQPSLRFTVFTTLLAIGLVVGWALIAAPANGTRFCLLVLTPVILSVLASDLVGNKLRLEDRYRYMALWQLMLPASRLAVAIVLFWATGLDYHFVAVAYAVVALLVTARALPHLRAMLR
ncbi:MAG TPA: hypothetical protein VLM17_01020, partial [Xanthomonadaceae bacterium]|nr:hypothetical protein [Xanthomonadaceae bacterium]